MIRRRKFLTLAGTTGAFVLAGCSDESAGDDGTGDDTGGDDATGEDDGTDDASGDGGSGGGVHPDLPDVEEPESYMMEQQFSGDDMPDSPPMIYEVHGDDLAFYQEGSKGDNTSYIIDGDLYSVLDGHCTVANYEDPDDVDNDAPRFDPAGSHGFTHVGTETVDGRELDVYRREGTEDFRVYVDPEVNHVRRLESGAGGMTTDFHSFGQVDPIEPPDLDCTEISGDA